MKRIAHSTQAARPCEPHEADKLQQAAFVAIQEVVRSAASDALPLVGHLIPVVLAKLHETLTMVVNSAEDRERQSELQVRGFMQLERHGKG